MTPQTDQVNLAQTEMLSPAQRINQTSGTFEYYTPREIVEAARECMGGIDLDPASSEKANEIVGATVFFTKEDDGLKQKWFGNVWLNHPFHAGWKACTIDCKRETCKKRGHVYHDIPSNADWVQYLVAQYMAGQFNESCNITFAATSEQWFQPLLKRPQCFLSPRTNYLLPDGRPLPGVTKGSVVTYFGKYHERFAKSFRKLGTVKIAVEYPAEETV